MASAALALAYQGESLSATGELDKAIDCYTQAIELDPLFAKPYADRGYCYARTGRHQQAIVDYNEAIRLETEEPSSLVYNNRALSYEELGMHEQAIADYNEALRINANFATALYNRGSFLSRHGRLTEALGDFSSAITLDSSDVESLVGRATVHYALGRYDKVSRPSLPLESDTRDFIG